jgi:hypothetical protein
MADFSRDIKNFQSYGTYNYQFDTAGNEILNPSSSVFQQVYFSFPLKDVNYNQTKVLSFYDPTFTEFVKPITSSAVPVVSNEDLNQQLSTVKLENFQLAAQLNELIAANEQSPNLANERVIKDTIIGLRIAQGEGQIIADFETTFPYFPLPLDQQPSRGIV